jgi:hypothetical protein
MAQVAKNARKRSSQLAQHRERTGTPNRRGNSSQQMVKGRGGCFFERGNGQGKRGRARWGWWGMSARLIYRQGQNGAAVIAGGELVIGCKRRKETARAGPAAAQASNGS